MMYDPLYWMIFLVTMVFSTIASLRVRTAFSSGNTVQLANRITGAEAAQKILDYSGITDVRIVQSRGFLTDHYNPRTKTLALSKDVYLGTTASAAGVAAHEVGHAIQHAKGYSPLKFRSAIVPVAQFGSNFGFLLIFIGLMLQGAGQEAGSLVGIIGLALFATTTIFSLITVPVEFNASARAKVLLRDTGIVTTDTEERAVRKVLTAAGLTYVAAALTSILNLLYWAIRLGLLNKNRK